MVYPFRLFGTFVHELSHGLAAVATGGEFQRFSVQPDVSGLQLAEAWRDGLLKVLALQLILDGDNSLFTVLRLSRAGDSQTDAHAFARLNPPPKAPTRNCKQASMLGLLRLLTEWSLDCLAPRKPHEQRRLRLQRNIHSGFRQDSTFFQG